MKPIKFLISILFYQFYFNQPVLKPYFGNLIYFLIIFLNF